MARAESQAILSAQERLVDRFSPDHRFVADLMAFQADLPPLDFSGWSGKGERNYIAAIHAAVGSNYEPMVGLFSEVIRRSYDRFGRRGR
jgi:hypothetical protein